MRQSGGARRMPAGVMALLRLLCRNEARCKNGPTAYITFRVTLLLLMLQRASMVLKGLQIGFQKPKRRLRFKRVKAGRSKAYNSALLPPYDPSRLFYVARRSGEIVELGTHARRL